MSNLEDEELIHEREASPRKDKAAGKVDGNGDKEDVEEAVESLKGDGAKETKQKKKKLPVFEKASDSVEGINEWEEDKETIEKWVPPKGQTGDGTTHLNADFGY